MKRLFFVVAFAAIMTCIALCSCGVDSTPVDSTPYEKAEMQDMEDIQGDISHLCYTDEDYAIFTSGTKKDVPEGPLVDTKCITVYDLADKKIRKSFNISDENYIYNVVPYMEGILYAAYDFDTEQNLYEWNLIYRNEDEKILLDKGKCSNYDRMPQIVLIGENPAYIFENIIEKNGSTLDYTCGIKKVQGKQTETILETDEFELLETTLISNGEEYFFLAVKDETLQGYTGNLENVKESFNIDGKLGAFAINRSYVAVSVEKSGVAGEEPEYQLLTFNLKTGKLKKYGTEEMLYRLSGGPGETCMCVDWTFAPYKVNLEKGKTEKIGLPKAVEEGTAVSFFPVSETAYLAEFMVEGNDVIYYKVAMDE